MNLMPLTKYKDIIKHCFLHDKDLIEKWHVKAGQGLSICVDTTHQDMRDANVEFFVVYKERELVGYFGKEAGGDFLTGFFVMPQYRNKKDIAEFWKKLRSKFGEPLFCGLFDKNQPAVDFIKRNGGKPFAIAEKHGESGVIYVITKEQKCH